MTNSLPPVTTRTELIHLLTEAAELEHSLAVQYLFTAFTLKQPGDLGITPAQANLIQGWSQLIYKVAIQEMLHLSLASNLLTAVGGAPSLRHPNFPQLKNYYSLGIASKLAVFSEETISRYMCWEKPETAGPWDDFCAQRSEKIPASVHQLRAIDDLNPQKRRYKTIGELYHLIESAFTSIPEDVLFIGPRKAQITNTLIPFVPPLIPVLTRESACQAIDLIVREGEGLPGGPTADCHFAYFTQIHDELQVEQARDPQFQPAWPVIDNPLYDFHHDSVVPEANIITDSLTRQVGELFTATYDLMVQILMRLFSNNGETEDQLQTLATASMEIMSSCLRPLGVMLTRMPAGFQYPGKAAGPSFEIYSDTQPLPHLQSAWTYFHERMGEIADQCQIMGQNPNLPRGLKRVALIQQAMVDQFIL